MEIDLCEPLACIPYLIFHCHDLRPLLHPHASPVYAFLSGSFDSPPSAHICHAVLHVCALPSRSHHPLPCCRGRERRQQQAAGKAAAAGAQRVG